jgi:DNA-binding response OmpR family regulator
MVKRILVIDDEVSFGMLVKKNLELSGDFKIEIASSGSAGISMVPVIKPHLIILDILMPDMDGFQVMEKLKKGRASSSVPVIVLSARGDDATREKVLSKGARAFLAKPIDAAVLREKIRKVLRGVKKGARACKRKKS